MKNVSRLRRLFGALMLVALTASLTVPAAEAGGRGKRGKRHSARVEWRGDACGPRESQWGARVEYRNTGGSWDRGGRGGACQTSHAAHRFFDGRMFCAGTTADGYWKSDQRCEDDWGHRLVDNPEWVAYAKNACR